jgi:hypothetical protein
MYQTLQAFISHEATHLVSTGVATLILVRAVRALPTPVPLGSRFYLWFYNFSQSMCSNPDKKQ